MKLNWKLVQGTYVDRYVGFTGKYEAFSVAWDVTKSRKEEGGRERLTCRLHGIKSDLGHFNTREEAVAKAEQVLQYWLNGCVSQS